MAAGRSRNGIYLVIIALCVVAAAIVFMVRGGRLPDAPPVPAIERK